ncbi:hypothetical protein BRADI_1g66645v3 [Brachypodium distachyon]|uniref:Uncharacterized protein n=1 Tax=Brachypodium distachyon TaxID=15368 RepID=A0A2K2DTS7_BRADI|nr:hypothetical protein BRADI_1g66645v3 [Brachypodium distachyon]
MRRASGMKGYASSSCTGVQPPRQKNDGGGSAACRPAAGHIQRTWCHPEWNDETTRKLVTRPFSTIAAAAVAQLPPFVAAAAAAASQQPNPVPPIEDPPSPSTLLYGATASSALWYRSSSGRMKGIGGNQTERRDPKLRPESRGAPQVDGTKGWSYKSPPLGLSSKQS